MESIKEIRIKKGLSVVAAAEIVGVTKSKFSRIELGQTAVAATELQDFIKKLESCDDRDPAPMFESCNFGRKTTEDYEEELERLEATGADRQTINKLKRRISYSRWYEQQNGITC